MVDVESRVEEPWRCACPISALRSAASSLVARWTSRSLSSDSFVLFACTLDVPKGKAPSSTKTHHAAHRARTRVRTHRPHVHVHALQQRPCERASRGGSRGRGLSFLGLIQSLASARFDAARHPPWPPTARGMCMGRSAPALPCGGRRHRPKEGRRLSKAQRGEYMADCAPAPPAWEPTHAQSLSEQFTRARGRRPLAVLTWQLLQLT